jgi:hypothetical protein
VIRQPAEHRSRNELAKGVKRNQQSNGGRRRAIVLGVKRQQRQDDGESENVDGDDQENRKQRRFAQETKYDGNRRRAEAYGGSTFPFLLAAKLQ